MPDGGPPPASPGGPPAGSIRTNLATVTFSGAGEVTKAYDLDPPQGAFVPRSIILGHHGRRPSPRRQYAYELRVNQLLTRHRPPVATPRLVRHDARRATLTFEAVAGAPVGPKYPERLTDSQLTLLIALASATGSYRHRPRWLRRLPIVRRLAAARAAGLLGASEHRALARLTGTSAMAWAFAHGDVTPRNVLEGPAGGVLIDWEWAGCYPVGYDLAVLWHALADLPPAREAVAASVRTDPTAFWLSALLVQLVHLEWLDDEHRPAHLRTLDELVARLTGAG